MTTGTRAPSTRSSVGMIATSVLASALGVVVAIFVDNLGVAVTGALLDRGPVLHQATVEMSAPGSDLAFGGGAVASLVAGAAFLLIYPGSRRHDGARLTMLWLILHTFRQGLWQLALVPFVPDSNAARALAALEVPGGLDLVVGTAGAVGMVLVALAAAPAFLAFAGRPPAVATPQARAMFVIRLALIPGVAGPLLAVPFLLPDDGTGMIQSLPLLGAFTLATVAAAPGTTGVMVSEHSGEGTLSWVPVIWLVVFLVVFQVLLRPGLAVPA